MNALDLETLGVDYLLVNSTNKYLLEYVPIEENQCSKLTGFTGDVGEALVCPNNKILLFVDSRFHIQADLEVNKTNIEVVKLKLGQKFDDELCLKIKPNTVLGIDPEKVSQARYEYLKTLLDVINVKIKFIENKSDSRIGKFNFLPIEFTGKTTIDKIKEINHNVLITQSEELSYICNIRCFDYNYSTKVDGKLLILNNEPILYTDYIPIDDVDIIIKSLECFYDDIKNIESEIYVDKYSINAKDYSLLKNPITIKSHVKQMKSIKNDAEIEHMKYCFRMTDTALRATRDWIYANDNLSEYDISSKLEENFKRYNAKSLSFSSIVAINENSALAHYNKSDKTKLLKDGDLVLIDCGAYYAGGLATDITRVFVKGTPSSLQKQVYTSVLKVFLNCFNYQIMQNTNGFEIDKLAHSIFNISPIDGFSFSHGLGHGIGIGVHEAPPNLSKNEIAKMPFQENMCFTIEPGLYNANEFGIRLENTCYLKDREIKSFTNMCFEEKLINYSMLSETEKEILANFEVV